MTRTEAVLLAWAAALALYSVYAAVFLPPSDSVSAVMARLGRRWPVIPLALSALLAHWFWPVESP